MKTFKWALPIAATLLLSLPAFAESRFIEASGEGTDAASARRDAQRNAIEQAIGVFVKASTKVENFAVVEDKISTHAQAFIKSFTELSPPTQTNNGTTIVRIRAEVTDETANQIKDDLTAMGIAMEQADYPKVMVYYDEASYADMEEFQDPKHVYLANWAVDNINAELGKKGFDYVLPEEIAKLKKSDREILQAKGGNDDIIRKIASRLHADYYVKFKIHKENGTKVAISVNMFEAASGVGKGAETGYSESLRVQPSITKAIHTAALSALSRPQGVMDQFLNKLKQEMSRGKEFVLVFDNVKNDDQMDDIEDALKGVSKKLKLTHSSGQHMEFTVYSEMDQTSFQRAVRKVMKSAGVNLDGQNVVRGNRINLFVSR